VSEPHDRLRDDSGLAPLIDEHGELSLEPTDAFFERLVVSIIRQQVSMASAAATRQRLFEAVEMTPEGVLAADDEALRDAGLSRQKTRYVTNVAQAFADGDLSKADLASLDDDEIRDRLTAVTGVGEWTANMQLLFTFGREDVFPVGDLGVRQGMEQVYGHDDRAEMTEYAERWRPYRSYATLYLWRVEEDIVESVGEVVQE
jgi:DNA-3-methyladenine glycosylase II